jgi:hypothetical protein
VAASVIALLTALASLAVAVPPAQSAGFVGPVDTEPPTGTITVNGGAARTSLRSVTLQLSSTDEGSGVTQMRFSKDGATWSEYQKVGITATWTLTGSEGPKQVYAQFMDGAGNESVPVLDTITLAIGPRAQRVSPSEATTGVSRLTNAKVRASERVKAATVNATTVWITRNGVRVAARVTYHADTRTIIVNPNRALPSRTLCVVHVMGVKDLRGNQWDEKPRKAGAQGLRLSFTTR